MCRPIHKLPQGPKVEGWIDTGVKLTVPGRLLAKCFYGYTSASCQSPAVPVDGVMENDAYIQIPFANDMRHAKAR